MSSVEYIVKRVARELEDGDVVNLGIGMPTQVANHIPEGVKVILQSENGFLGLGGRPEPGKEDMDIVDAGGKPVTINAGGAFFDSSFSFMMIRGGHVDKTILGALQVDQHGNLANWMVPGKMVPGMGGAMDLVVGAKKVIVAMEHLTRDGSPKILKECSLPLTACNQVNLIVTNMAVIEVGEKGLILKEIAPGFTLEEVIDATEAELIIGEDLIVMADDMEEMVV